MRASLKWFALSAITWVSVPTGTPDDVVTVGIINYFGINKYIVYLLLILLAWMILFPNQIMKGIKMIKLKPELDDPKYYLHLVLIVLIAYAIMKYIYSPIGLSTTGMIIYWTVVLGLSDITVHTLLKLD